MSLKPIARKYARRYFGPKGQALFLAQMGQESGFRGGQTSSAGAQGPAQLMPGTAKAWGVTNPNDPEQAYGAAAKHMAMYLKAYGGSWDKALTAYNAGPGRVGGALPAETVNYIKTIRANAGNYAGGATPQSPAGRTPDVTTTREAPTFDAAGFKAAQTKASLGGMIAKRNPNSFLIRSGLLTTAAPNVADFQGTKMVTTTTPGAATGRASSATTKTLLARAATIDAKRLPYRWGGGHGGKVDPAKATPLDCSGAVSAVLGINPRVSGAFESWGKPGRAKGGKGVTVYANSTHVLMEIDGHFFGTSRSNPGGGAGWIPRGQISKDYLKRFTARHG